MKSSDNLIYLINYVTLSLDSYFQLLDQPASAIVIGFGQRGSGYACYALARPKKLQIVGIADPSETLRDKAKTAFNLTDSQVFKSWEDVVKCEKMADIAIVATQDRDHKEPAIQLARKGYHILLEKPMAVTYDDCKEIVSAIKYTGVMFGVCHVLRYYPPYRLIKQIIENGELGEICHITHTEPVGFWHFSHSYVRGNWRNEQESSCSLLAKCCHDLDLMTYWMGDIKCSKISSFGSLMHFTKENKPAKATDNCLTCPVHETCSFSAQKVYIQRGFCWPTTVVCSTPDIEELEKALKNGPYGRCVYDCDNDVMSNQVVNMQFENGAVANINMMALTKKVCARETVISGTKGEIRYGFSGPVEVYSFINQSTSRHYPEEEPAPFGLNGHQGADFHLIKTFVDAVIAKDRSKILAGPDETLESHRLVFMAERSRIENQVINLTNDF